MSNELNTVGFSFGSNGGFEGSYYGLYIEGSTFEDGDDYAPDYFEAVVEKVEIQDLKVAMEYFGAEIVEILSTEHMLRDFQDRILGNRLADLALEAYYFGR